MFLEVQHIEKNFGTFCALNDVSVAVEKGSVFGLLGPNGAGKTTLIRIINHIIKPDKGSLLLEGHTMTDTDVRKIGYLPEERGLYKKMKVGEQAVYLARLKGLTRHEAESRLKLWFDKFQIADWWNRPVEELSKGMQQKVQFIVTVLHEPDLLIFDEPFSGFDPVNATLLKNEILSLRDKGATVIFSTHNMSSVEELCDDIALINKSRVVLSGDMSAIRRSYSSNQFEVVTRKGTQPVSLPSEFHVEQSLSKSADEECLKVTVPEGADANALLALLLPQRIIVSIKELLPSMNDIFIKAVNDAD